MLTAGSYVTSLGVFTLLYKNLKAFCIQHGERRIYFLKLFLNISINAEKNNNSPNYVERFKVPTVLMVKFTV